MGKVKCSMMMLDFIIECVEKARGGEVQAATPENIARGKWCDEAIERLKKIAELIQ